jgi:hypothetical protein
VPWPFYGAGSDRRLLYNVLRIMAMPLFTIQLGSGRFHLAEGTNDVSFCANHERHTPVARHMVDSFLRSLAASPLRLAALRRVLRHDCRIGIDESLRQIRLGLDSGRLLLTLCREERLEGSVGAKDEQSSAEPSRRAVSPPSRARKTWIEIELVDEAGDPVPNAPYRIELPDGRTVEGRLDDNGLARHSNIDPGNCQVSFPEIDASEWKAA